MTEEEKPLSIPRVVYQNATIDFDFYNQKLYGTTTMWLMFSSSLAPGDSFFIHNRADVEQVWINNVPAEYEVRDGLVNLAPVSAALNGMNSKWVDLQYRSAIELSNNGEMRIQIPEKFYTKTEDDNLSANCNNTFQPSIDDLHALPLECDSDVLRAFNTLDRIASGFRRSPPEPSASEDKEDVDVDGDSVDGEEGAGVHDSASLMRHDSLDDPDVDADVLHLTKDKLIQLKITYVVGPSEECSAQDRRHKGIQFRMPTPVGVLRNIATAKSWTSEKKANYNHVMQEDDRPATCVYTTGAGGDGIVQDFDGVRCWLPCIDTVDQRPIFDINIRVPDIYTAVSCGKKIECTLFDKRSNIFATRFITAKRVPAYSVGFFVGQVEAYSFPLYRGEGNALVALNIHDVLSTSNKDKKKKVGTLSNNVHGGDTNGVDLIDEESTLPRKRRSRSISFDMDTESTKNEESSSSRMIKPTLSNLSSISHDSQDSQSSYRRTAQENIYIDLVRHTTLGLDLSVRILHKFTGQLHGSGKYTQVYVPHLGDPFLSFDGFSLLDASLLHSQEEAYKETAVQLTLIKAYCLSWLFSCIPLESLDSEFILYGTVGFLQNFYVEQVFGEEEGSYRVQKCIDSVLELEKQGHGLKFNQEFPVKLERLGRLKRQLFLSKSTVLFHLLENRIGGRDAIRLLLSSLIQSTPLYDLNRAKEKKLEASINQTDTTLFFSKPGLLRSDTADTANTANTMDTDNSANGLPSNTPLLIREQSSLSNASRSAYRTPFSLYSDKGTGGKHTAIRAREETFEDVIQNKNDCISTVRFVEIARSCASGVDTVESFVMNFLKESHALLFNISLAVERNKTSDRREDRNATRMFKLIANPLFVTTSDDPITTNSDFHIKVVERVEDIETDCPFLVQDKKEVIEQELTKIPSRRGPRRGRGKGKQNKDKKQMSEAEQLNQERKEKEKEEMEQFKLEMMDSLELARHESQDHPIKLVYPDPNCVTLQECRLNIPDTMLVELLFLDQDANNVLRQVQALRSLSMYVPEYADREELDVQRYYIPRGSRRLQLKAFSDCFLNNNKPKNADLKAVSSHHYFVGGEAAFALAQWQNNNAPKIIPSHPVVLVDDFTFYDNEKTEDRWIGLACLLAMCRSMFMNEEEEKGSNRTALINRKGSEVLGREVDSLMRYTPMSIDLTNDAVVHLLVSLLVSIASVKSYNGATPQDSIDMLMVFARHCDTDKDNTRGKKHVDNAYFKAYLLYALSHVRPDPGAGDTNGNLSMITKVVLEMLHREWTITRLSKGSTGTTSNMDMPSYLSGDDDNDDTIDSNDTRRKFIPSFENQGLVTAAALACLIESDIQVTYNKARSLELNAESSQQKLKLSSQPTCVGWLSKINYTTYFLPPGTVIGTTATPDYTPLVVPEVFTATGKKSNLFEVSTPLIRSTALECFLKYLFAQHLAYHQEMRVVDKFVERVNAKRISQNEETAMDINHSSSSSSSVVGPALYNNNAPSTETAFIPMAFQCVLLVLRNDPNRLVRRQAVRSLLSTILYSPSQQVPQALGLQEYLNCISWSDPNGYSVKLGSGFNKQHRLAVRNCVGIHAYSVVKELWEYTLQESTADQVIRSELMVLWFGYRLAETVMKEMQESKTLVVKTNDNNTNAEASMDMDVSVETKEGDNEDASAVSTSVTSGKSTNAVSLSSAEEQQTIDLTKQMEAALGISANPNHSVTERDPHGLYKQTLIHLNGNKEHRSQSILQHSGYGGNGPSSSTHGVMPSHHKPKVTHISQMQQHQLARQKNPPRQSGGGGPKGRRGSGGRGPASGDGAPPRKMLKKEERPALRLSLSRETSAMGVSPRVPSFYAAPGNVNAPAATAESTEALNLSFSPKPKLQRKISLKLSNNP